MCNPWMTSYFSLSLSLSLEYQDAASKSRKKYFISRVLQDLYPTLSVRQLVGWSIGWLVRKLFSLNSESMSIELIFVVTWGPKLRLMKNMDLWEKSEKSEKIKKD